MAECISYYVLLPRNVLQVECVRGQLRDPTLLTCIKFGLCHNIREWVVICPHGKRVPFKPMAEFLTHILKPKT